MMLSEKTIGDSRNMTLTPHEIELMKDENGNIPNFSEYVKEDLGIVDNLKADVLMRIAYDRGHSAGYYEVYLVALELVELIK